MPSTDQTDQIRPMRELPSNVRTIINTVKKKITVEYTYFPGYHSIYIRW